MIRYAYARQLQPPAPFVHITLRYPVPNDEVRDVPAQIDTAADRTLLPEPWVQRLQLPQMGILTIGGVGGVELTMPTYPVLLSIHDLPFQAIEVVACAGESWVMLGRDVLNGHRLLLDGPQLSLTIG